MLNETFSVIFKHYFISIPIRDERALSSGHMPDVTKKQ